MTVLRSKSRQMIAVLVTVALAAFIVPTSKASAEPVANFGDASNVNLNKPIAGIATTRTGNGYWLVATDGGIFAYGDARFHGSMGGLPLNKPIVGMTATPSGNGYWLVASDGGIFAFGDAQFHGSMGGLPLNKPIVGMTANTASGYWLVASDGGIFAFGSARFQGSMGGQPLNKPVNGMASTTSGNGYWLVASDGGIFAFGDAGFYGRGSTSANTVGMTRSRSGAGYWIADDRGVVSAHGDVAGVLAGQANRPGSTTSGIASMPNRTGFWLTSPSGGVAGNVAVDQGPTLAAVDVVTGLNHPWGLAFTPDGKMLYTQRNGRISLYDNGANRVVYTVPDLQTPADWSEVGLLGIAVDRNFASNRNFYACYTATNGSNKQLRVSRFTLNSGGTAATRDVQSVINPVPYTTDRHAGCQLAVDASGYIWMTTGDFDQPSRATDPNDYAGKVLRFDRNGNPAPGNTTGTPVWSIGHRNAQGIAFRPGTNDVYSIEHGDTYNDEINLEIAGANYGWAPDNNPATNDMTNRSLFPSAVEAKWSSGASTVAPAGGAFLNGSQWKSWNGHLIAATLKDQKLMRFSVQSSGEVVHQGAILPDEGRLRGVVQGPDGSLYVTTSNGGNADKIFRIIPS